jgi:pyruvate formate lyase activating enzyme
MKVNFGGIVPLSTVDWPGRSSMAIFLRGCPLRCPYCQNSGLQLGENFVDFSHIANEIKKTKNIDCASDQITLIEAFDIVMAKPFISAIVISGGEPLMQPEQVKMIANLAKGLELDVGLETSGYYPDNLSELLKKKLIDKVFLDIKAPLKEPEYEIATGRKDVSHRVLESLRICMKAGIPTTARNTIFIGQFQSAGMEITKTLSNLRAEFPENRLEVKFLQKGIKEKKGPGRSQGND